MRRGRSATTAWSPTSSPGSELNAGTARHVALGLALALAGAVVGTAAVLTHGRTTGLVLGMLASYAGAWALPGGWSRRFAFTTGWIAVLALALVPRSGGGYLIGSDTRGYVLMAYGLALMLFGIVTVRPLRPTETPSH